MNAVKTQTESKSDMNNRKLSQTELTKAVTTYARRHNHYVSFVRANSVTLRAAIAEYLNPELYKTIRKHSDSTLQAVYTFSLIG